MSFLLKQRGVRMGGVHPCYLLPSTFSLHFMLRGKNGVLDSVSSSQWHVILVDPC